MSAVQIILGGVGGQGLIASGSILAKAAVEGEGRYATLSSAYGVETRGTFAKSDLIVSDAEILFPEVTEPDWILAMAQPAYDRYADSLGERTRLVYDSGLVTPAGSGESQTGLDFTGIARELGTEMVANTVAIGYLLAKTGLLRPESVQAAIRETFANPSVCERNLRALESGLSLAEGGA